MYIGTSTTKHFPTHSYSAMQIFVFFSVYSRASTSILSNMPKYTSFVCLCMVFFLSSSSQLHLFELVRRLYCFLHRHRSCIIIKFAHTATPKQHTHTREGDGERAERKHSCWHLSRNMVAPCSVYTIIRKPGEKCSRGRESHLNVRLCNENMLDFV